MTAMIKRLHFENLLLGTGLAIFSIVMANHLRLISASMNDLDIELAVVGAGLLILLGIMRKAWRNRESRQWIWFVYGVVATLGLQLFARVFMERFSDLYLTLWLQAFKAGLI